MKHDHPPGRSYPDRLLCELVEYAAYAGIDFDDVTIFRKAKRYTDGVRRREERKRQRAEDAAYWRERREMDRLEERRGDKLLVYTGSETP